MRALEGVHVSVCAVYWPDEAPALWVGTYGTAKVYKGDPLAVLSTGERVPL